MRVTLESRAQVWQLDRPAQDNGIDLPTMEALEDALWDVERDADGLVCILVLGQPGVFSTGLDSALLERCFADASTFQQSVDRYNRILERLEALPVVSIACLQGACRLGGLELALACDLIVADEDAAICDGHRAYDAMPGGGGTRRLPARIGYARALRFILGGDTWTGAEACVHGLVDEAVVPGTAPERARAWLESLAGIHPSVVQGIKASLRAAAPPAEGATEARWFRRSVIERLAGTQPAATAAILDD